MLRDATTLWVLLACCQLLPAQTPLGDGKTAEFLWSGVKTNIDRLQRDAFTALDAVEATDKSGKSQTGNISIFCCFDYEKDLFRFDRDEPAFLTGADFVKRLGGKYARTPKQCDSWTLNGNSVVTWPAGKPASDIIRPFDVRSLGLYDWASLSRGYSFANMANAL